MRDKLPDRRYSVTLPIIVALDFGKQQRILITVGFDEQQRPREVFCADFKAGTSIHSIVMDSCILLSRLLQHGDTPGELLDSMCTPLSLIGSIAQAVRDIQQETLRVV